MKRKGVHHVAREVLFLTALGILAGGAILPAISPLASEATSDEFRVYSVDKKVSDFPPEEDFSTPEAAYVAINRVLAVGDEGAWRRISVKSLAGRLPPADAPRREVSAEEAQAHLHAQIVEVRIFRGSHASVIALLAERTPPAYDERLLGLEGGRWLNRGRNVLASLERARVVSQTVRS